MNSNNSINILSLFTLFFFLTTIASAQEKKEENNSTTSTTIAVTTTTLNETNTTTSSTTIAEEVEPLESWKMKPLSSSTTTSSTGVEHLPTAEAPSPTPTIQSNVSNDPQKIIPKEEEKPLYLDSRYKEKKVLLFKKNELRINKAAQTQREIVKNQKEELYSRDTRGPAELILCGINVNGYGLKNEYQEKYSAQKGMKKHKVIEKSLIEAINKANCNIVALQNFLSPKPDSAKEGLTAFTEKLNAENNASWRFFYPEYYKKSKFTNAFLINSTLIQVLKIENLHNIKLPKFEKFLLSSFVLPPTKITLNFTSPNPTKTRKIILLTSFLGTTVASDKAGLPNDQMQLAEVNRVIMKSLREEELHDEDLASLIVDRASLPSSNPTLILEGRLHLKDFQAGGSCKLDKEYKVSCNPSPNYFKDLFGTITEGIKSDTKDKKMTEILNTLSPDIYFFDKDLKVALSHQLRTAHYKTGFQEVKNSLKNSPLVWVELNW